jgi:endonuclease/exonuclease/phosphatase family metal-dependent hydrolase
MAANIRDITFASVNLFNLQRPGLPMYPTGRPYTEEEYAFKVAWTAGVLRNLDADVIAFQELWSRECLGDVFGAAGMADDYAFAFIKEGAWDGIAVAAAVRKPWRIERVTRHKQFPEGFKLKKRKQSMAEIQEDPTATDLVEDDRLLDSHEDDEISVAIKEFSRSPLQVTVGHGQAANVPAIEAFCTHLKSKLATRLDAAEFRNAKIRPHAIALGGAISTIRRTAEAAALRIILNQVMTGNDVPTVVLGDLNDGQLSNTLDILTDQPSYRLYADSIAARSNDDGLYTVATLQQLRSLRDVYYTHDFKGVQEVIDHVLVSEQFSEHSDRRRWTFRDMRLWNDHIEDPDPASSDHGVVAARFDWNPPPG